MGFQRTAWGGAALLGMCLVSPWWLNRWQVWDEALVAQSKLLAQQRATQDLYAQTAALRRPRIQPTANLADVAALTTLARQHGLQLSQLGLDRPSQTAVQKTLQLQQLPIHMHVQGPWHAWLGWLAQWPVSVLGMAVSSVDLKADPQGGISAQVVVAAPQIARSDAALATARTDVDANTSTDPFNAQMWTQTQRAHAQQHPSYAQRVVPELMRARDPLEAFPRERLQYVGQITRGAVSEALVKVLASAETQKEPSMMTVHRVRVGTHLGQNFGRVLTIAPDDLQVQELVLTSTGEWQPREVHLPLKEGAP
jgi:Tfp pilus assembly protein PilP